MIQSQTWVNILLSLVCSPITLGYLPILVNHFGEGIVKGHRVYIDEVLEEHLKGKAPEEILYCFKNLPLEKIYATLLYYEVNKAEIDAYLQRVRQYHEKLRQEWQTTQGPTLAIVAERNRLRKERERLITEGKFDPILDRPAS